MSNPEHTVYFRGFPEDINNEELEIVFAKYGTVTKCFVHKSRTYGMVEYEELRSCGEAIRDLHNKPPLNLYLNMARNSGGQKTTYSNNENKKFSAPKSNNNVEFDNVVYEDQVFYIDEDNAKVNVLIDPDTDIVYVPIQYAPSVKMIVRKVAVQVEINGSADFDDTASNSSINTNRKIKSKDSSPFNISIEKTNTEYEPSTSNYQRGNTSRNPKYGNKNEFYNKDDQILTRSFENRSNDISNRPNDVSNHSNDFSAKSNNFSAKSNDFSGDQKPNHVAKSFENRSNDFAGQKQNFGGKTFENRSNDFSGRSNDFANKNGQKFNNRRLNNSQSFGPGDDKPRFNKKFGDQKFGDQKSGDQKYGDQKFQKREFNKPTSSQKDEGDWSTPSAIAEEKSTNEIPPPSSSVSTSISISASTSASTSNSIPIAKKIPFSKPKENKISYKALELPKNIFTLVQVEHTINDSLGYVKIYEKIDEFEALSIKIIQGVGEFKKYKPEVGKLCVANYEDMWYRAVVLTVSPKITVRFIDYGNENEVNDELLELSPEFTDIPAYAILIKLANGSPCKMETNSHIKVKPMKIIQDDIIEVHVENGIYEEKSSSSVSVSKHTSLIACQEAMMKKLLPNTNGSLMMTTKLSNKKGIAFFYSENTEQELNILDGITDTIANNSITPKIGDLVAAEHESWNRAFVMDVKDGFKVAFIDFGVIKTVPEVRKLNDSFKNICQFSCEFTTNQMDGIELDNTYVCKIIKVVNNTVHCKLAVDADERDITFTLWKPEVQEDSSSSEISASTPIQQVEMKFKPAYLELKNGDDVKVFEENDGFIYVRTKECSEILKRVEKYTSEHIAKAPKLTKEPEVGDYVAGNYENSWYRALVKNVTKTGANILYIDYGNVEVKPFFSLKQLDEQSCKEPCTLIKIKLKGLIGKQFSAKHRSFLANLCEGNEVFKASFEGSVENGVELTTKSGKNISDELAKLDSEFRKEEYMKVKVPGINDPRITMFETKELTVGKGEIIYLSDVNLEENSISVCENNPELLYKVHCDLVQQMTKYVNHFVPNDSYVPIIEEIVLVQNKDKWYRALIIEISLAKIITVFFVDYGFNLQKSPSEIRKMPKEFCEKHYPVLANFATISGLPSKLTPEMIDLLENYFTKNETYTVEVLDPENDCFPIRFPEILSKFQAANLI